MSRGLGAGSDYRDSQPAVRSRGRTAVTETAGVRIVTARTGRVLLPDPCSAATSITRTDPASSGRWSCITRVVRPSLCAGCGTLGMKAPSEGGHSEARCSTW